MDATASAPSGTVIFVRRGVRRGKKKSIGTTMGIFFSGKQAIQPTFVV